MKKTIYFLFLLLFLCISNLGAKNQTNVNMYDYLKSDGRFTIALKLIDDLNYKEFLSTAINTLLVAKDSAYAEFFKNNQWHVSTYEQLTVSQKKYLLKFSMITYFDNSFTTLTITGTYQDITCLRKQTSMGVLDSVPQLSGAQLPAGKYWDAWRSKGMHLLSDNSAISTVFFNQKIIDKYALTPEDVKLVFGVDSYSSNNLYFFNNPVINGDIACANGYIHVLKSVLLPRQNMADFISTNIEGDASKTTKIFAKLLDRFCMPFYDYSSTAAYRLVHPEFTDSIFVKRYFSPNGGVTQLLNGGVPAPYSLAYSPAWNNFPAYFSPVELDMATMFVPSDDAMTNYMNSSQGSILKREYGSWDNVPDEIVLSFINRIMRWSFLESLPVNFSKMKDVYSYPLPVEKSDIVGTYTALNGEVYITNKVYPPRGFVSTYSPVQISSDAKIMNWAINISQPGYDATPFAFYKLYLNSLMCKYGLFIPTDQYFTKYIDPIAYGQDIKAVLKYRYNTSSSSVNAVVYKYDALTGVVGDSVDIIISASFIKNRLWDVLNSHIVPDDVQSGKQYYVTRNNDILKVSGFGSVVSVQGGGDVAAGTTCNVTQTFNQENGHTYFLDKLIQPALRSVYKVLNETPEFSMFADLLKGVPQESVSQIFVQQGVDFTVKFFNTFRYTVYVPTNEAIQAAIAAQRIKTWAEINAISNATEKAAAIEKMVRMLKYHFQDNAVFVDNQTVNGIYPTATIKTNNTVTRFGTAQTKFLKVGVTGGAADLTITTESGVTAHVVKSNGLYNIIAKDYVFAALPSKYKNVDGTGSLAGATFSSSLITSSSSAIIHQIDNVLIFE
ncbi:MAG: fasciclin domain-containing protein [Paludibacter sp.]